MTDAATTKSTRSLLDIDDWTRRRNAAEARFRAYGIAAIAVALLALVFLTVSVLSNGLSAFRQTFLVMQVQVDPAIVDPKGTGNPDDMSKVTTIGYGRLLANSLDQNLSDAGIALEGASKKDVSGIVSKRAVTVVLARSENAQAPLPEHPAPDQPTKPDPG